MKFVVKQIERHDEGLKIKYFDMFLFSFRKINARITSNSDELLIFFLATSSDSIMFYQFVVMMKTNKLNLVQRKFLIECFS